MKVLLLLLGGLVVWGSVTGETGDTAAGPPTAATEIPTSGGHGSALLGLLVVVGLVALVAKAGGRRGTPAAGLLRSEGGAPRRSCVKHERAHVRALRKSGAGGASYRRRSDGTWVTTPRSESKWNALPPEKKIGVYTAGHYAAPDTRHDGDDAGVAAVLTAVPSRDQGRVLRKGQSLGRRWAR